MTTYARKRTFLPDSFFSHSPSSPAKTSSNQAAPPLPSNHTPQKTSIRAYFSPNVTAAPRPCSPPHRKKPRLLTQTTIDLGGDPRRTCTLCGMQYLPAAPADVKTHAKFCARAAAASMDATAGVEVTAREMDGARIVWRGATPALTRRKLGATKLGHGQSKGRAKRQEWQWGSGEACIFEVTRRSSGVARAFAERLLGCAEEELGAVRVMREALWDTWERQEGEKEDAFKVYVYAVAGRGVGLCLAQRVCRARRVLSTGRGKSELPSNDADETHDTRDKDISGFEAADELVEGVVMGISRIWVARDMRGAGVARELLEVARRVFVLGRPLTLAETAFSQPTDSGLRLARKWYDNEAGWLVYDERCEEDNMEVTTKRTVRLP